MIGPALDRPERPRAVGRYSHCAPYFSTPANICRFTELD